MSVSSLNGLLHLSSSVRAISVAPMAHFVESDNMGWYACEASDFGMLGFHKQVRMFGRIGISKI